MVRLRDAPALHGLVPRLQLPPRDLLRGRSPPRLPQEPRRIMHGATSFALLRSLTSARTMLSSCRPAPCLKTAAPHAPAADLVELSSRNARCTDVSQPRCFS